VSRFIFRESNRAARRDVLREHGRRFNAERFESARGRPEDAIRSPDMWLRPHVPEDGCDE
jgi:hypothetical protein